MNKPRKEGSFWNFLSSIGNFLIPLVVAGIGGWFTHSYNMQQEQLNRIKTLDTFMKYIKTGSEPSQQQAAIRAIDILGFPEIAIQIASFYPNQETINTLMIIRDRTDDKNIKEMANNEIGKLETVRSKKQSVDQTWQGEWDFNFSGTSPSKFMGRMSLVTDEFGMVTGEFSTEDKKIKGKINGKSPKDNAESLKGTWSNNLGQQGKFRFNLINRENNKFFKGNYSLGNEEPKESNTWDGTKVKDSGIDAQG